MGTVDGRVAELASREIEPSMNLPDRDAGSAGAPSVTPARKQWSAPVLVRMGSLAAITGKVTNKGTADGGTVTGRMMS